MSNIVGGNILHIQGIVLAGGKSSRMGTNKALLSLHNKKVIEHIIEEMQKITKDIIIIANEPEKYERYNYPIYSDRYKNKGPLAGLETALYHMQGDVAVISPCDTPLIHHLVYEELLGELNEFDAIVPKYEGQMHPLSGIYRKDAHRAVEQAIQNDQLRMTSFFDDINTHIKKDFGTIDSSILRKHFFNMNTIEEFNQAKTL